MRLRASRMVLLVLVAFAAAAATTNTATAITISPGGVHSVGGSATFNNRVLGFSCHPGLAWSATAGTYAPGDVFAPITFAGMDPRGCRDIGATLETVPGDLITVGPLVGGHPSFLFPIAIRIPLFGCRFAGTVAAVYDAGLWRVNGDWLPVDTSDPLTAPSCVTWPGALRMWWGQGVLPGWTTTLP